MTRSFDGAAKNPADPLGHLPGHEGWPFIGSTIEYFRDQEGWSPRQHARYGRAWKSSMLFRRGVVFQSADAAETLLLDRDRNFSNARGWGPNLASFFPNGLMLRDLDDHRLHRRMLQSAFRRAAMEGYVAQMRSSIAATVRAWPTGRATRFHPRAKRLLLQQASEVFLGLSLGDESARVQSAFTELVGGTIAWVPFAVPGLAKWRGLRGRAYLEGRLRALIPARRAGDGTDMFSRLCREPSEEGERLSDDDVVDHMIFLLMAAHDTTTSALTTMAEALGRHREWQARLRDEARSVAGDALTVADLDALRLSDLALREAMRLYPPVPLVMRQTVRACEVDGVALPADTTVWLDNAFVLRDPAHWTDPERFDPERFNEARAEHKRHRFCWVPFGGGAHTCIGMQFAVLQAKMVMHHLLKGYRWRLADERAPRRQMVPFPKPFDDLPLVFERV